MTGPPDSFVVHDVIQSSPKSEQTNVVNWVKK